MRRSQVNLRNALEAVLNDKQDVVDEVPALLGAYTTQGQLISVPDKADYCYARLRGNDAEVVEVFNDIVLRRFNTPIKVIWTSGRWEVIKRNTAGSPGGFAGQPFLPNHALQHMFYGGTGTNGIVGDDVVWVSKRQWMPLNLTPSTPPSMRAHVWGDYFMWAGAYHWYAGTDTADFTFLVPASATQARFVTVLIDQYENLEYVTGSLFAYTGAIVDPEPVIALPGAGAGVVLGAVMLNSNLSAVQWSYIWDMRAAVQGFGDPGTGTHPPVTLSTDAGLTFILNGQDIDLEVHGPREFWGTPTGTVGTAKPVWRQILPDDLPWFSGSFGGGATGSVLGSGIADTLALWVNTSTLTDLVNTVPGANLLNVVGLANGDSVPAYKALFDTTDPTTITVGAAASPGTQIVAARRDHAHAITAAPALLGNGTVQYQTIVTGATPFAPVYSGFLFDGTTGGKTVFSVTNTKVLTFLTTDTYTVTIAGAASIIGTNTGDVTLASPNHGLGLTNQVITLGTPSTLTSATTNAVTTTTHTHAITGSVGLVGNGTSQYQFLTTGATPFAPIWSVGQLDIGSGGLLTVLAANSVTMGWYGFYNGYQFSISDGVHGSSFFLFSELAGLTISSGVIFSDVAGYEQIKLRPLGGSYDSYLKLVANAGADRIYTTPDVSGTFALGAGTLTSATTNNVTVANHTHEISGSFTATAHNLLSAQHGDTTAASPTRGDIITAQGASPTWHVLAISAAPGATYMNFLGAAFGDTEPGYKALFDGNNPTWVAENAPPVAGTSLLAAHRDHQHSSPSTWAPTAHNILSASHTDTTANALTAGAMLYATNAVPPKLTQLPGSAVDNAILQYSTGLQSPRWTTGGLSLAAAAFSLLGGGASSSLTLPNAATTISGGGTFAGTAGQTYTFPAAGGTVALLGTANVFTESNTIASGKFLTTLTDGNTGGLRAGSGSDVLWYRGAADTWRTPDSVIVDTALMLNRTTSICTLSVGHSYAKTDTTERLVAFFGSNEASQPFGLRLDVIGAAALANRQVVMGCIEDGVNWGGTLNLQLYGGGVVVGNPTGGDKGAGSINAVTVWRNGTALDYVFEPGYKMLSIKEMQRFYEKHGYLPTLPTSEVNEAGSTNVGALTDRLWETVEVQAMYIAELSARVAELKERWMKDG